MAAPTTRIPAERLRRQVALVLDAWGMPEDQARAVIDVMVETDLRGVDSHGISMLPLSERAVKISAAFVSSSGQMERRKPSNFPPSGPQPSQHACSRCWLD